MINPREQVSQYFTWGEALFSQTAARKGLDNTPTPEVCEVIKVTARHMDEVRELLGWPVHVNSWYRSPKVNAAVGGSGRSQHMLGEAVDLVCPQFGSPAEVAEKIMASKIEWDQLLIEFPDGPSPWVHISFTAKPRRIALVTHDGRTYARV
jgi:hypothetical protein